MGYPEPLYTICCVAEVENPNETGACPECNGTQLQSKVYYEADGNDGFEADVFVSGASLQSYRFDKDAPISVPGEYSPDLKFFIPYPDKGFHHLCLKYNREGGARINVVAVNVETGKKIRPLKTSAHGTDKACPIESASLLKSTSIDYDDFFVGQFLWDDTQWTVNHDQDPGAWTIEPGPDMLGNMVLTVQRYFTPEEALHLQFKSWERNRLSNWVKGEEHQWTGYEETIEEFDDNNYFGIIVYYESLKYDPNFHEPTTKPGKETPGYPAPTPKVRLPLLSALLRVWSGVVAFVKRVFLRR